MTQNHTRQPYIRSRKVRDKWANFDAQPRHVREALAAHPLNIWPSNTQTILPATFDELYTNYLAGLESVWGPDHPAVQDARKKVVVTRGKAKKVLQFEDLF